MINENKKQKKHSYLKDFRKYILFFIMYSMFGWIYEVFLEVVVYKWGFSNRGFLFGPYCTIYGFGALIFLFLIYPLIKNKKPLKKLLWVIPVFLGCMSIATLIELMTSYIMEWTTGSWPWQTYVDYDMNFQGRIALSPSLRFGLGGIFFLYIVQPIFEKIVKTMNEHQISIASNVVVSILLIDFIYTVFFK
jgi:uncharacterized membrane protein